MPDIGSLQITVDASQAKTAAAALEQLSVAGGKAEASTDSLKSSQEQLAASGFKLTTFAREFSTGIAKGSTAASSFGAAQSSIASAARQAAQSLESQRQSLSNVAKALADATNQAETFSKASSRTKVQADVPAVFKSNRPEAAPDIRVRVDATSAERAAQTLDRFSIASRNAAQASEAAANSSNRVSKEGEQFVAALKRKVDLIGKDQIETLRYDAALAGVSKQAERYISVIEKQRNAQHALGASAGQTRAAFQQLHFQITDVFTSLASGQNPFTVLIQQGGQIKDSFGGVGAAFKALASLITPVRLAIGGIAAALALVAYGYRQGSKEQDEFVKSLAVSGHQAGVTTDQLTAMADSAGRSTGRINEIAAALALLAKGGGIAASDMQEFAKTAVDTQHQVGTAVEDTIKKYRELAKDPVEASKRLNEETGFLTVSLYKQITSLVQHGEKTQAATVAMRAFNDAQKQTNAEIEANKGALEHFWDGFIAAAKGAKDAILDIGRAVPTAIKSAEISQQIATIDTQINALSAGASRFKSAGGITFLGPSKEDLQATRNALSTQQAILTATERNRRVAAENKGTESANAKQFAQDLDDEQAAAKRAKSSLEQYNAALEDTQKRWDRLAKQGSPVPAAQQQKEIEKLKEDFLSKDKKTASTASSQRSADLADIKNKYQARIDAVRNGEQVLDALRSAGLKSEGDYFAQKKFAIQELAKVQIEELEEENKRLGQGTKNNAQRLQNQKQIADNERQIQKLKDDSATKQRVLDIQEQAQARERQRAIRELTATNESYIASLQRRYALEASGVGVGNVTRQRQQELAAIEERLIKERENAEQFRRERTQIVQEAGGGTHSVFLPEDKRQYEAMLAAAEETYSKESSAYEDRTARIKASQADWTNGAKEAFANYYDAASNTAKQFEDVFTDALKNLEDGLVQFIKTGKFDFKSFVDFIQTELLRISVRQTLGSLVGGGGGGGDGTGLLGSLISLGASFFGGGGSAATSAATTYGETAFSQYDFSGGTGTGYSSGSFDKLYLGGRAHGGPVSAGGLYRVNEQGPELLNVAGEQYLMMGNQSGSVTPNDGWSGGGGITQVNHYHFDGAVDKRTQMQVGAAAFRGVSAANTRNN